MKRWLPAAWLALTLVGGCFQATSDDESAPAVSAIATAAYSATGADYPPPGGGATSGSTGIPSCDEYLRKIAGCTALPPSARTALEDGAKTMREAIAKATSPEARTALEESCKQAAEALSICDTAL